MCRAEPDKPGFLHSRPAASTAKRKAAVASIVINSFLEDELQAVGEAYRRMQVRAFAHSAGFTCLLANRSLQVLVAVVVLLCGLHSTRAWLIWAPVLLSAAVHCRSGRIRLIQRF